MLKACWLNLRLRLCCLFTVAAIGLVTPSSLKAQSQVQPAQTDLNALIRDLERQLEELKAAAAARQQVVTATSAGQRGQQAPPQQQSGQRGQAPAATAAPGMPMPAGQAGGNPVNPEGTPPDSTDPEALLERIKLLEQRIRDLETSAVLSEPETRVRQVEIYVDENGIQHEEPVPGAKKEFTFQRERVYRRQTINEKIEEALADAADHSVEVGVNAGIVSQFAHRTQGTPITGNNHAYELASADLFFTAGIAQNTLFFADVVALSGPPPDLELGTQTLVNGYSARLVKDPNQLSLREAWLRTELFDNSLALTAGHLDLTNYFDHNVAANDETSQFISDALVNNPALGLSSNGPGLSIVLDPKNGFNFKIGFQQSNPDATNLSDSIFSLAEIGYLARLPAMGEGNYRFWYRTDNTNTAGYNIGFGTSIDQKIGPQVTLFGRYGASQAEIKRDHFYSAGLQFAQGLGFYPGDKWGVGYSQLDQQVGPKERLVEVYYNLSLAEKFNLSFHVQHFQELLGGGSKLGYLVPGVRLGASF